MKNSAHRQRETRMYENREQTRIQENQELLQQMDITKQSLNWRNQREEQNKEEIIFGTTCLTDRQEKKVVFING